MNNERQIMTVEQTANYTGYAKTYIYALIGQGKIPSYKPSGNSRGKVFLDKNEIDNFLFGNRRASNKDLHEQAESIINGGVK